MDKDIVNILNILDSYGGNSYLIGGAVRDFLKNIRTNDYDIATSLTPDEVICALSQFNLYKKYKNYGNISLKINGKNIEITTFRIDSEYDDYRHPKKLTYTKSLKEDVLRRDFTINAIAMNKEGNIFDYVNGIKDLSNNLLRIIGEPKKRFAEDLIRVYRTLRFISKYNFYLESKTESGLLDQEIIEKLNLLEKGIICKEIVGIIDGNYFYDVLTKYKIILKNALKIFEMPISFEKNIFLKAKNLDFKLSLLYFENEAILEELNLISMDLKKINLLRKWILGVKLLKNTVKEDEKRIIFENYNIFGDKIILNNIIELYEIIFNDDKKYLINECLFISDLKIKGNDLLDLGFNYKMIKSLLREILLMIILNKLTNDKDEIINYLKMKL